MDVPILEREVRLPALPPRTVTVIAGSALATGLIADQLLRTDAWGVNVPIVIGCIAAAAWALPSEKSLAGDRSPWLPLAACFFAIMWVIRDAELLLLADLAAALAFLGLSTLEARGIRLAAADALETALTPPVAGLQAFFRTPTLLRLLRSRATPSEGRFKARAIFVSLLLAAPLVLLFGGLFASADPVFGQIVSTVFRVDPEPLVSHSILTAFFTWMTAGYLLVLAAPPAWHPQEVDVPAFQAPNVFTPLIATVVVFGLFIGVQLTTLFGGAAFVQEQTGLTFAEYARGGFFQCVFASGLVLPLVYLAPRLARDLDAAHQRKLRSLLLVQLALAALVLASALWRMLLYIQVYALTEDRLYTLAVMAWIAATIVIFAVTIVPGRPMRAALSTVIAAAVALGALNLVNPKALIARWNLSHATTRLADFDYFVSIGGDAVPVLVDGIDAIPEDQRCRVVRRIMERYGERRGDWRGWNLGSERAYAAAQRLKASGAVESCPAPPPPTRTPPQ